jgi:hypoxanthine phosphoribosyltransferase
MVQHKGKAFVEYINENEIQLKIIELAKALEHEFSEKKICVLAVLDGSFVFAADLIRQLKTDVEVAFCKYKSYSGTESLGELTEVLPLPEQIKDKHVLIVEDIVDTGLTLAQIIGKVEKIGVKSIKTASLLFKPEKLRTQARPDFVGFEIEDKFVIGYGMDFDGFGRQLPSIYQLHSQA